MSSNKVLSVDNIAPGRYPAETIEESKQAAGGVQISRHFTRAGVSPYDEIEWELRTATIGSEKGEILFEQKLQQERNLAKR